MNEELELKIERYLGDLMTPQEVAVFEKELKRNDYLRREVALSQKLGWFLANSEGTEKGDSPDVVYLNNTDFSDVKTEVKEINDLYFSKNKSKKKSKTKGTYRYLMLSAAAVILLFIGINFFVSQNGSLYGAYYNESDLPSFTTRSENLNNLAEATNAYLAGELESAALKFRRYLQTEKNIDPLVYIYTGLIKAEQGDLDAAIGQLKVLEKSNSLDANRALWFEALVYLKFNQKEKAKNVLNDIIKSTNNYKYNEAQELLERL